MARTTLCGVLQGPVQRENLLGATGNAPSRISPIWLKIFVTTLLSFSNFSAGTAGRLSTTITLPKPVSCLSSSSPSSSSSLLHTHSAFQNPICYGLSNPTVPKREAHLGIPKLSPGGSTTSAIGMRFR